ncbi:ectoine/hydroxyectoine ABC transporter permease subunit EhuD [Nocardioides panacisoli]|uniref:ectoine/hydroxyectoine ABC transporter permease subunit EhuD n=1 Tax=Nocardioides panacisoli TaxID=627624 RepID=UPI001C6256AB|nr:ectoine/hydroxyectoine ABC transporter permease subunit EhuD [Nocardioides panacisoli]QYJ05318.1 ectoine/hydroxyectoine ABC transporter permease subunit EhuD [Nocardioides panacisoli]
MTTDTDVRDEPQIEEFRPHRKWYRRPDIMVPLVLVLLGYSLLVGGVDRVNSYDTSMEAPGGLVTFDWAFFFHMVPLMVQGMLVTAKGALLGFAVAIVLGFFLALGRRTTFKPVSWPTAFLIEFIRSTPLLVQLFFWQAFFRYVEVGLSPMTILMVGLGIHYATYCSEAYRAGINSVDAGQWEAATALNLGPTTKWTRVIIPQAVPNVLPALGNFLVAAFKDAPMGVAVNVHGMLFFANQVRADTFRDTEPYLLIGLGFLMLSLPAAWAVRQLERKIAYERV